MTVKETKLGGCYIIEPKLFKDKRGYFFESYSQQSFKESLNLNINFVQDNESQSFKGVLRGLHYQIGEYAQAKLVRVIKGHVLDVALDVRKDSPTFGQHISVELNEANKKQLFIPRGFAHGFVVLSETAIITYKCDNYYNKNSERGVIYNDPDLKINWRLPKETFILSEKDIILPTLVNAEL